MRKSLLILLALLVGCAAAPEFIQVSEDTFLIKRSDQAGIFGNAIQMREAVLREADAFAAEKGKVAEKVVLSETPVGFGRFAKVEYTFRLVDPQSEAEVSDSKTTEEHEDVYTELLKLEDLRQRGILTEEEFAQQKKKLLDAN